MATTKKKKGEAPVKKAATTKKGGSKKTAAAKQIEELEKALKSAKAEDVENLVPEDIRADVKADMAEAEKFENPENINLEAEMEKVFETAEPSEEVKEQVKEFEATKEEFNKEVEKAPEKTEDLVKEQLKKAEELKKRAIAMKAGLHKENQRNIKDEIFTNWWNGSSNLF